MGEFGEGERERVVLREGVDPLVAQLLACADPWDAYHLAVSIGGVLSDGLVWMPHGGHLYVAWAELTDVYEISATPLEEAHRLLRAAAAAWMRSSGVHAEADISAWLAQASALSSDAFARYGPSTSWLKGGAQGP